MIIFIIMISFSHQVKRSIKPTDPMFKQQWFLNHGAKVRDRDLKTRVAHIVEYRNPGLEEMKREIGNGESERERERGKNSLFAS